MLINENEKLGIDECSQLRSCKNGVQIISTKYLCKEVLKTMYFTILNNCFMKTFKFPLLFIVKKNNISGKNENIIQNLITISKLFICISTKWDRDLVNAITLAK